MENKPTFFYQYCENYSVQELGNANFWMETNLYRNVYPPLPISLPQHTAITLHNIWHTGSILTKSMTQIYPSLHNVETQNMFTALCSNYRLPHCWESALNIQRIFVFVGILKWYIIEHSTKSSQWLFIETSITISWMIKKYK